ncbi:hypothetical protein GCM10022217_15960 [Chryseobacterium ginsenosidimutans]|uniref:hypothetical protein n=1 Tax=Chryseobacterium ginsenosidimutans TaxID=687846 RepID=UPI0031D0F8D6
MEYKALLGNDIIDAIRLSFKESTLGAGISIIYDVKIEPKNEYNSTLILTPKDGSKELKFSEILEFGIMLGTDFMESRHPDFLEFSKKRNAAIEKLETQGLVQREKRTDKR